MAFASLSRLARGLARTRESLADSIRGVLGSGPIDEESLEDLEAMLLAADLGPTLTEELIEAVRKSARGTERKADGVREVMRRTLREALPDSAPAPGGAVRPRVVFVVGSTAAERRRPWGSSPLASNGRDGV